MNKTGMFNHLSKDFPASIVVFLVAMPLCLGIALASGAPLFSGIIAGIIGGIVVGTLSGSALGVSGPAAGLAVIVLSSIEELGGYQTFLAAVVISGVIQVCLAFLKAGIVGYYFPSSVIKGMLSGIGIIIIIKQIPHALGQTTEAFFSPGALIVAGVSLGILILWEQSFMKKIALFKTIQGPLVVVVFGIAYTLMTTNSTLSPLPSQLVSIPVFDSLAAVQNSLIFPVLEDFMRKEVWIIALTIAIVGSLETLLCLEATDKIDPLKRVSPTNQELFAQGVGNTISGLIGGLPITQVIVRSSTNIQSGGRTKLSAILHGVIMLASAMLIPTVLNYIPLSSLAAILFVVGYKLAKPSAMKTIYQLGWSQFLPYALTITGMVAFDLLTGIIIGLSTSILQLLYNNYRKPFLFEQDTHLKDGKLHLELAQDVTFINKASIQQTLQQLPNDTRLVVDAHKTTHLDLDVKEILEDFIINAKERNIDVEIMWPKSTKRAHYVKRAKKALRTQFKDVQIA